MPRFRALFTDLPWKNDEIERAALAKIGAEVIVAPDSRPETLVSFARDVDAIGVCWAPIPESLIAVSQKLKIISRMGIGLDNIDVSAATIRRIMVTNIPDYCVEEVATHAIALLLALARNVAGYHLESKRGHYVLQSPHPLHRLSTQTLGLLGLGRIGRRVSQLAQALGMRVIAHSPSGNVAETGCQYVSLEGLFAESDFLSLHAPLNPQTRHIVNSKTLALMKPTSFLINTSRGGLVDHAALWGALMQQSIAGAGLDVFDPEPPDLQHPLFRDDRVIVTPHSAFVSEESLIELRSRAAQQMVDALEGRIPHNRINPQILSDPLSA